MTADPHAERVAALAEVLEGHRYGALTCYDHTPTPERPSWCCVCGAHDLMTSWRTHLAAEIAASPAMRDLLAEERARALREAAAEARVRGDIGRDGQIEVWDWLNIRAKEEQP